MDARGLLDDLALTGAGYAAPVAGHTGVGFNADDLVTPASVMKIQVALTIENAIGAGAIDGSEQRVLTPERGVVTFPDGAAYAVAVFTRRTTETTTDPALIDAGIGRIARALIDRLRESSAPDASGQIRIEPSAAMVQLGLWATSQT